MHIVSVTISMVVCLSERITMNKNKNTIHNQKHLTLTERIYIEQELVQGSTFSSIASIIDKDPSTISKEVKRARIIEDAGYTGKCHACQNYGDCFRKSICGDSSLASCLIRSSMTAISSVDIN